jgi:hypothetical protein
MPLRVIRLFCLFAYASKLETPPNKKASPDFTGKGFVPRTGFPA